MSTRIRITGDSPRNERGLKAIAKKITKRLDDVADKKIAEVVERAGVDPKPADELDMVLADSGDPLSPFLRAWRRDVDSQPLRIGGVA